MKDSYFIWALLLLLFLISTLSVKEIFERDKETSEFERKISALEFEVMITSEANRELKEQLYKEVNDVSSR